jgi:hypothetical protein
MTITVTCPKGHLLRLKDKYAGQSGLCPYCYARVQVPKSEQISEDEVLAVMGPSSPEVFVQQEPSPKEASGISLLGSAALREKAACLKCGKILSAAFAICPLCGEPLSQCVVSVPPQKAEVTSQVHRSTTP